jgi:3-keto-disaccharide hydrolase
MREMAANENVVQTREEIAMKRPSVIAMGLLGIGLTVLGCASMPFGQSDAGWTTLINGATGLDNWNRVGDANWRAEGGAIVADKGKGGFLVSKNSYKDFQIRAEFWADHTTNSGIFIRCTEPDKITATNAYEVNIYDQRPDPSYGTGGIVNVAKVSPMPKAGGKWNTYEITAKGSQLTVVLNGVQTANVQNSQFAQGPFALQFGNGPNDAPGGVIKWRKVQIKSL